MRQNLDRYVGRAIAGSFAAALLFFLLLWVLLDLLNNLGGYLDKADKAGIGAVPLLWHLAGFYARLTPFSFVTLGPFVTVIGCNFAISRLMTQNEVQPMLFVGRSMARVLRPALICGALVGLAMAACWQWVVPRIASEVAEAQSAFLGGDRSIKNVVLETRSEQGFAGLRVRHYDPDRRVLEGVQFLRVGRALDAPRLICADSAQWDERLHDWRLENGTLSIKDASGGEITDIKSVAVLGTPDWTPEVVRQRGQESIDCDLFSYDELFETRRARPNRVDVAMALHRHVTYPLANIILLLLALPFAIHFERGGRVERVLGAIGVCAAYLLFDLICQNLGHTGYLRPVVAAWSPTILFGSLGVMMFSSLRS
jgi:lipopolysaccharide export system permease protein